MRMRHACEALSGRIRTLAGWPRAGLAFAAGAVSALAMAPVQFWPVLFASFPVLVWLIDGSCGVPTAGPDADGPARPVSRRRLTGAALIGWWFGFGYFLAGLYWIGAAFLVEAEKFAWLMPMAVLAMPAGLALFYALAALLAARFWCPGPARIVALALAFGATEWTRGHVLTGFPWNSLGYGLTANVALMQLAAVFGTYGLTFWAVSVFAAPAVLADRAERGARAGAVYLAAMLVLLGAGAGWGWARLAATPTVARMPGVKLRLVQPNVPQKEKWQPQNRGWIFARLLDLSRRDGEGRVDDLAGVTHLVWPESSLPFLLLRSAPALRKVAAMLPDETSLLVGALRMQDPSDGQQGVRERKIFNSLLVLDSEARLQAVYDKFHLVPFGEYLPWRETLGAVGLQKLVRVRGGFDAGPGLRLLTIDGLAPFSPLICYEAIFPGRVALRGARPGWLLNLTNDAWFGVSAGPYQHLHQARIRAVEEGLAMVRGANSGITAVIDPLGRIVARLDLETKGTLDVALPKALTPTPFVRFGDAIWLAEFGLGIALYLLLGCRPVRRFGRKGA